MPCASSSTRRRWPPAASASTRSRRRSRRPTSNTPVGTLQSDQQQLTIDADTQLDNAAAVPQPHRRQRATASRCASATSRASSIPSPTTRPQAGTTARRAIILAVQRQPDANTVDGGRSRSRRCCRRSRASCRPPRRWRRPQRPLDARSATRSAMSSSRWC